MAVAALGCRFQEALRGELPRLPRHQGEISGAIALDNPIISPLFPTTPCERSLRPASTGTAMVGFSEEHGGPLTEKQIDILVEGISGFGSEKSALRGLCQPIARPWATGRQGQTAFGTFCASCHGADGNGGKAGSVVHPAYLGLVSDQYLRTIVIAGRNDLGCPDFQNRVPGKPMSEEEISGVVAWLVSQRKNEFGQPLPLTQR